MTARRPQLLTAIVVLLILSLVYTYRSSQAQGYRGETPIEANSTLQFERIFAISLPSRTDRQDALTLMSAISGLDIEVMPGIKGEDVLEKTIPKDPNSSMKPGFAGSWRAHLNAMKRIVDEKITTALIIEDDVDFDIRVREQMMRVINGMTKDQSSANPELSADWDLLWLGNIAERFPKDDSRKIMFNDPTIPESASLSPGFEAVKAFPDHSRFVHPTDFPACTYAYAVSYAGAQKILYHASLGKVVANFDTDLANNCWLYMNCLSITPPLFHFDRSVGLRRDSDTDSAAEKHDVKPGNYKNVDVSVRTVMREKFDRQPRPERSWRSPDEYSPYFVAAMDLPGQ